MSCCGTRYRVNKFIIKSQHQEVPGIPKIETRQDDIIHLPKEQRKFFKCKFNLTQLIKPQHMVVASVDYTNLKGNTKAIEVLGQLMREDNRSRESFQVREGVSNIEISENQRISDQLENKRRSEILEKQRISQIKEPQIISEKQKISRLRSPQDRIRQHQDEIHKEQVELHVIDQLSPKRQNRQVNKRQQQKIQMMIS